MSLAPTPAELFPQHISRNPPENTNSALARLGLTEFDSLPTPDTALQGTDSETMLSLFALLSHAQHQYRCKTCRGSIETDEINVLVGGLLSYGRDGKVYDHHHLHTDCFKNHEIHFWLDVTTVPSKPLRKSIDHKQHSHLQTVA